MTSEPIRSEVVRHEEPSSVDPMVSAIERFMVDPNADIEKLERMLQMKERLEAQAAKRAFTEAMAAAQAEMRPVVRDKRNTQTNSNYATLEAISNAIQPIITRHGFETTYDTEDCPRENHMRIVLYVSHVGGHTRRHQADIPLDVAGIAGKVNKTPTHAFGSTMSYGRRYLRLLAFDLATDDDDGNAAGSNSITMEQYESLRELMGLAAADEARFLAHFKIDMLDHLPAEKYGAADALLRRKIKERNGA